MPRSKVLKVFSSELVSYFMAEPLPVHQVMHVVSLASPYMSLVIYIKWDPGTRKNLECAVNI